jgi:hypothetical protein
MYAPRQPNARPALEQDPGRIRHLTPNVDIGVLSAADMTTLPRSDHIPTLQKADIPREGPMPVAG